MRYKLLGRSGLRVSELSLGTMTFGEDWGWGASKAESRRIFDEFSDFELGFPWSFLHDEDVLELVHGDTNQLLDRHR
jgi:hypothetical protein